MRRQISEINSYERHLEAAWHIFNQQQHRPSSARMPSVAAMRRGRIAGKKQSRRANKSARRMEISACGAAAWRINAAISRAEACG